MKPCRWLITLMALLLTVGIGATVQADWVDITDNFTIISSASMQDEGPTVAVSVENILEEPIQGTLRLLVKPIVGTPIPIGLETAGEDGNNNFSYYLDIVTGQADVFDAGEIVHLSIPFDAESIGELTIGEYDDPSYNLTVELNDASIDQQIFRKKISKTPEFKSGEALIKVIPVYVTAQSTQGDHYKWSETGDLVKCGETCDDDGLNCETVVCSSEDYARVKPLVVTYIQEEEAVYFNSVPGFEADLDGDGVIDLDGWRYAHEVYAAVSLDDGLTWKRRNISRTALKSSFTLPNGVAYPGDSEKQDLAVAGPYVFVTWIDKFCKSGNPWDMPVDDDIYQVTGPQKSVDYLDVTGDEEPRPDLGVRPFSCLWGARGVLELDPESPNYGTVVWYKAEQLSSGRRDAIRNFTAGVAPMVDSDGGNPIDGTGGFAVTWQEDPKGLKTGKGRGPGAGMSGACVNHKTDVWYSSINWADFALVDEDFVSNSDGDAIQDGGGDPMSEYFCANCPYVYDPEIGDPDHGIAAGTAFIDLPFDPEHTDDPALSWSCPVCGAAKDTFEKDAKPHALVCMTPPVRISDNAVCRERIVETIVGYEHDASITDCDYTYEGGTNNQPLLWSELPDGSDGEPEWVCPKCGLPKSTFVGPTDIGTRREGAPYCEWFADNPRLDKDGNYAIPGTDAHFVAYYTLDGEWKDIDGTTLGTSPGAATINADGTATIGSTRVYWSGEPMDGNTGASRPNLSLVNWGGQTLALIAYEETKGVGVGSDKVAAAMEQAAPIPLVDMGDGTWEAGFTNSDCRSCHYQNVVPRDRVIPMDTPETCSAKGATWVPDLKAYFPYTGYPYITEDPVTELPDGVSSTNPLSGSDRLTSCVKFFGGRGMYPRDWEHTELNAYYALPDHMPGWHQEALDCTKCHLPYNTKDVDQDNVKDRADKCLETPFGESVDLVATSPTYGCSSSQDPNAPDNNKDEPEKFRHGKNVYYHNFAFDLPMTIEHGAQINGRSRDVIGQDAAGNDIHWSSPGSYDIYENARRVRVVPNMVLNELDPDAVTLGLLYKEGKDGQGAPADAILRIFRGGFDIANMDQDPLNMSSSTPYLFQDPAVAGNEDGTGDNRAGDGTGDLIGNHNTPKIDYYYWTDANLKDPTGVWLKNEGGDRLWQAGVGGYETPKIKSNPFENVFSTRLDIFGDTMVAGFAYCSNWSAGKKAKDHYDFFVRVSKDRGATWTLPVNVSKLKNHEETVSDCRVYLTPRTIEPWPEDPGAPSDFSMNGAPDVEAKGDFNVPDRFFVAVGTKENIPQPNAGDDEDEEVEILLDAFYSRANLMGTLGGEYGDLVVEFETYQKENPKYDPSLDGDPDDPNNPPRPYLTPSGQATHEAYSDENGLSIPNQPNPAYGKYVDEFNWLAKGDANQGDVQVLCNPMGSRLYTIWEQELPIVDEDGQKHFQGSDVWFRKVYYDEPGVAADGDVNGDLATNWEDGRLILRNIGTTAYDPDFLWAADYVADNRISGQDFSQWKKLFIKQKLSNLRARWTSK